MADLEQVGWVKWDGDEFFDFRYFNPADWRIPPPGHRNYLPVYVDRAALAEPASGVADIVNATGA